MKLTRPEVTDMKNPRYIYRRYLCPYCTLRVSKSLDLWCVFERLSNFEKCNLRSGHWIWPGGVTFGVIRLPNCWLSSYGKFGGATRRRFFCYLRKTWGGRIAAPGRARVNQRPTAGGAISSPPLVFLRYLLNQCRYHDQTCSTLSPNIFTHCVKILKSRVL